MKMRKEKTMKIRILVVVTILSVLCFRGYSQTAVTLSGNTIDKSTNAPMPFVNVVLLNAADSSMKTGMVSNDEGLFVFENIIPSNYILKVSFVGYETVMKPVFVGSLSPFLNIGKISLESKNKVLGAVKITAKKDAISSAMDKKVFKVADNASQAGGSALQSIQNLPGVTSQDGKVLLRGSDKVMILIDGKQTALTGIGGQSGLENIPASAIDKIEIINNPSAQFDANGNAGIINIIYKKEKQKGLSGKVGLTTGLGSLWQRTTNLPNIRPQYVRTPKINPSVSLNYQRKKTNWFLQADNLYNQSLYKNEFTTRTYDDGTIIKQQLQRNRNTNYFTLRTGVDYQLNDKNSLTVSGMFGIEKILDHGDQPFYNNELTQQNRLWTFLEDELKTTAMASANFLHKFKQPGHNLKAGINYTFHREDEKYYFTNQVPAYVSTDSFKLISDEKVIDGTIDYTRPLKFGQLQTGIKIRKRDIPTNMIFQPGEYSALDTNAGGAASYQEFIPSAYTSYLFENKYWSAELGLRMEYVNLKYTVGENHPVYKSDGYNYTQPFPNVRLGYKLNNNNQLSFFYNRRIDRPNEVDIRIFPKYDDAEIIKVGNPALRPQYTNTIELGHKFSWDKGFLFSTLYLKNTNGTITRLASTVDSSRLIYSIFQNVNGSNSTGAELFFDHKINSWFSLNASANVYQNQIDAFSVENIYPIKHIVSSPMQQIFSGNFKLNNTFNFNKNYKAQLNFLYLAPDLIPQGKIFARYSVGFGLQKTAQNGKGEWFINATDIFNTLKTKREITANGFSFIGTDYNETQVVRIGYSYKF